MSDLIDTKKKTKSDFMMPKEVRIMMVGTLENANILTADNLDDKELLDAYNKHMIALQNKLEGYEATAESKSLNEYVGKAGEIRINDKEFIMRLFNMNVPYFYLTIFKDADTELTDREIWLRINRSGINPLSELGKEDTSRFKIQNMPFVKKTVR